MSSAAVAQTHADVVADGVFVAVRLDAGAPLADLIDAVIAGGLRLIEMTLTTPGALEAISALASRDDCIVGAGTVLTAAEARDVAAAGGRFAMSPVVDPDVIAAAHAVDMLAVPGAGTATEILTAHRTGARMVKVFPAGPLGGPQFLRKIRGPLPDIELVPTSGPTIDTIGDYVAAGAAAVGVGAEIFARLEPEHVTRTAARIRAEMDAARGSEPAG